MIGKSTPWLVTTCLLTVLMSACTPKADEPTTTAPPSPTTTQAAVDPSADPGFYLNLMWHQHQPLYPKDANGVYTRPWVRVHATKDYYDMASTVAQYPNVNVTFNLTPVLMLQLEDLAGGAKDIYWTTSEIPAVSLSDEDKQFIAERFFDVNPKIIARFPRYQELAEGRSGTAQWTDEDWRDLQVLFNLAWTDLDFLEVEPLAGLVAKGRGFSEEDKVTLFAEHLRIISEVLPLHRQLWESGQIEITTTPLAHPILPLIFDTNLATVGDPTALLPDVRFQEILDADDQVIRGLDTAERLLGQRPVGMWPGEGSVAQLVMSLFSKNGVEWVASGESVLAKSIGVGSFERSADEVPTGASDLYRPWSAQLNRNPDVAMFFRDDRLSDLVGFEYSGSSGEAAAADFMRRLKSIHDSVDVQDAIASGQPYVVSVILDGENAWESYDNDGKDFLNALYRELSGSDFVKTITPGEYLDRFEHPEGLDEVWAGAWFQPNFATWIGEEEEALAWDYLAEVRADLKAAKGTVSDDAYAAAYEQMLFAEGSDWFWWYGSDQDSGHDTYFDTAYRELLGQVYDALGRERPLFVSVPIIPAPAIQASRSASAATTPLIDGLFGDYGEGGEFGEEDDRVFYAFDQEALYLGYGVFDGVGTDPGTFDEPIEVYLSGTGESFGTTTDGDVLGFRATHVVRLKDDTACVAALADPEECVPVISARSEVGAEVAVPFEAIGLFEAGDTVLVDLRLGDPLETWWYGSPLGLQVPDISNVAIFLDVEDPVGDDHGPGTYTYPTDSVFGAGSYDLTRFTAGTEGDEYVFSIEVVAPIQNPWGSPRGLSIQTFDLYVDTDPGAGTGARQLIDGRNASLAPENGWEYGITIEGWDPAIYVATSDGTIEETKPTFDIIAFGDKGKVVVRVPQALLSGDPETWGITVVVLSQEGFPSAGVRRVRDVDSSAQQWRIGGGTGNANGTRILDVLWPVEGEAEQLLSDYPPATALTGLSADDFGFVSLVTRSQ